jgi:hypothetical protein
MQEFGRLSLLQKETVSLMSTLNGVCPFRSTILHNWGYGAGTLIEYVISLSLGHFLEA